MKLMISFLLFIVMLLSADNSKKVMDYLKWQTGNNPNLTIKKMYVSETKKVDDKWTAYIIKIDAIFRGKEVSFGEIIFSDGIYMSADFVDMDRKESLKQRFTSLFDKKYYSSANLIYGSSKAKNKIAVFSDPLCPYCIDLIPKLIDHAKKYPKTIALYYYHFPLESIHPTAPIISKAMVVAHNRKIKDYAYKIYNNSIQGGLSEEDTLSEVNKALGLKGSKKITKKDIDNKTVIETEKRDLKIASDLLLNGTPVVFINGIKDDTRQKYLELGK